MKRLALIAAVFLVLIAMYPVICFSAVTGTVTYTDGTPVADASITFIDESNPGIQFTGVTEGAGSFEINLDVTGISEKTPQSFNLGQNYPNPFNPTTTIPFTLDARSHVTLSIYNIIGQRITRIVDTEMGEGNHSLTWDGTDSNGNHVGAGVYLYQLKTGNHTEVKKMLLLDGGLSSRGGQPVATKAVVFPPQKAETAQINTYTVTITHDDIVPYEGTGVVINDGDELGFIVQGITSDVPVIEGITFVTIPEVTEPYVMNPDDGGDFSITLSSYKMSTTVITNAQYTQYLTEALISEDIVVTSTKVLGATGEWIEEEYLNVNSPGYQISYNDGTFEIVTGMENRPVVGVTWFGAKAFAAYYGLDLPTEAEWQYAASGGMNYEYGTDDGTIDHSKANYSDLASNDSIIDVGTYPANPFGLYDMAGNVWEWCNDWYGDFPSGIKNNYSGVLTGAARIIRGGCAGYEAIFSRSDHRGLDNPESGAYATGFRVVRRTTESTQIPNSIIFVTIPTVTEPYEMESRFSVTLSSYEMSTTEVTNAQYAQYLTEALASGDITATSSSVQGASGDWSGQEYLDLDSSYCQISYSGGSFIVDSGMELRPVVEVTWYGAKSFAVYYDLDLPTEAEWQYAASGGMDYEYGTNNGTINSTNATYSGNVGHTTDVGSYPANPFGLYDMAGNVWEWCHDWYGNYPIGAENNYTGVPSGTYRVKRGGSWGGSAGYCQVGARGVSYPADCGDTIGFRVVRIPGGSSETPRVSGSIIYNGAGLSDVTVTMNEYTTISDSNGLYTFTNISNGTKILTYTKPGYYFNPPSIEITLSRNDINVPDVVAIESGEVRPAPDGLTFVTIPEVTEPYTMNPNDGGYFKVTLSSYEMSTTEVTNAQYVQYLTEASASGVITATSTSVLGVFGNWRDEEYIVYDNSYCDISYSDNEFSVDPGMENRPVVGVTWYGAKAFAEFYGLDLPTEAEWQYAASGGMNYEYGTDDGTIDNSKANYGNNVGSTTDVGTYPPNPFGLYDMTGNVGEWCYDWKGDYPEGVKKDYMGVLSGSHRMDRGDYWVANAFQVDVRGGSHPVARGSIVGFRVVRRTTESTQIPNSIIFVTIPAVTDPYVMNPFENADFSVTLDPFDMSITEITNAQYVDFLNKSMAAGEIMVTDPPYETVVTIDYNTIENTGFAYLQLWDIGSQIRYTNDMFVIDPGMENCPVTEVSWFGAKAFAEFYGLDLPTEAEWQYAASGGMNNYYGNAHSYIDSTLANYNSNIGHTIDVGSYPANPFGLYDMAGNVLEWCNDWYGDYPIGTIHNYEGISSGSDRILRGGDWRSYASSCTVYYRGDGVDPIVLSYNFGFRVVRR